MTLTRILVVIGIGLLLPLALIPMNESAHPMLKRAVCILSVVSFLAAAILHRYRRSNKPT